MISRATRRLAAAAHARQLVLLKKADAAANAAERGVRAAWSRLLRALQNGDAGRAAAILRWELHGGAGTALGDALRRIVHWSYRGAARAAVGLMYRPVREAVAEAVPDFLDILFPPLTGDQIHAVIYGGDWRQRLAAATRLANPDVLAQLVWAGLLAGKTQQQIAREIRPAVQGVLASARRVARTEAMRVAQAVQMAAHEQLGDLVIGYQIHATLDRHTRPWHQQRDGTVYYKNPGPGQKGMAQMPNPPDEAADPRERPPGTPHTAWNCRCYLTPVLRP